MLTFAMVTSFALSIEDADIILGLLFMAIVLGGAFSWLIFLCCYFLFNRLPHKTLKQVKRIKPIISGTAILAMLGFCLFFGISFSGPAIDWVIPLCYAIGISIATFTTKLLEPRNDNQ